jgi:hypothetical protein
MSDIVKNEIKKVHAVEVSSQYERDMLKEIFAWASITYPNEMVSMDYHDLCRLYWEDYFKSAGTIRLNRNA